MIECRDRVVSKTELLDQVWPGLAVEENNLQVQVSTLRRLLGAQAIATVPGRGYRFTLDLDAPASPTISRSSNLPRNIGELIGRDQELAQLRAPMATNQLVTVSGPGSVGKTRLVLEAATVFVDAFVAGTWLVELASLSEPALVPTAITSALGMEVRDLQTPTETLVSRLKDQELLLVLDNCEHVLDAVALLLETLLAAAPGVKVLLSSQELIGIAGEQVYSARRSRRYS